MKTKSAEGCKWHFNTPCLASPSTFCFSQAILSKKTMNSDSVVKDDWIEENDGIREDYKNVHPEGLVWSFCDTPGDDKMSCKIGRPKAGETTRKRRRVSKWTME